MGVKPDVVISATFIIGAVLAAIAGIMYASNYGTAHHTMGFLPGLKAFTAAVFGGIGNLAGAVVGAMLLGLIESIGSGYIGDLTGGVLGSHYTDIDRKSTRLNSSHLVISYAVFCLKKKKHK